MKDNEVRSDAWHSKSMAADVNAVDVDMRRASSSPQMPQSQGEQMDTAAMSTPFYVEA